MMHAEDIASGPQTRLPFNRFTPSRPLPGPFVLRLRDSWAVLMGRAEAVIFYPEKEKTV